MADFFADLLEKNPSFHSIFPYVPFFGGQVKAHALWNLTTKYANAEFNRTTPNHPDVTYFSYGAKMPSQGPPLWHPLRWTWKLVYEREGDNDGLVSVKSAHW